MWRYTQRCEPVHKAAHKMWRGAACLDACALRCDSAHGACCRTDEGNGTVTGTVYAAYRSVCGYVVMDR